MPARPTRSTLLPRSLGALLALVVLVAPLALPAGAQEPRAPYRYPAKIEALAPYDGQRICSPAAKAGTTAFANLLLRTYPSTRSMGISRSCSSGGRSEHKEGRAFDWGASAYDTRDAAAVRAALTWLLKTDRHGNRFAMARRLGVQYIIWNRRIWGAYSASSGWRRYTGANPHTDHVHFSLSWPAARKRTSFWNPRSFTGGSVGPKPTGPVDPGPEPPPVLGGTAGTTSQPDRDRSSDRPRALPEPTRPRRLRSAAPLVDETVRVRVRHRAGTLTRGAVVRGRRYLVEASGRYRHRREASALADAECSRGPTGQWGRNRSVRRDQRQEDHLDLYLDGQDLWAGADNGRECDETSSTYRWVFTAARSGRVPLQVWDPTSYRDNRGGLRVRLVDLDHDDLSWKVPAHRPAGATSPGALRAGVTYDVTVTGTWSAGTGTTGDAACLTTGSTWRLAGSRGNGKWAVTNLEGSWIDDRRLSPERRNISLEPANGDRCDDRGHRYTFRTTPDRSRPLNLRVSDASGYADNRGALTVRAVPVGPAPPAPTPTPTPPPPPADSGRETVLVDSAARDAVPSRTHYRRGDRLSLVVRGTWTMRSGWSKHGNRHGGPLVVADAECTDAGDGWQVARYDGWFDGRWGPLGDLTVSGLVPTWRPLTGDEPCDPGNAYRLELTVQRDGPLWFAVADDDVRDNVGVLTVEVTRR